MIPQSFIQDLLHRVDIVDVIERYVKLKRAGANFVANCPFHTEKSPSFTVSQTKQFYHCFGCGEHGTAISFLMEFSGLGFIEAVKDLAQSVGLSVPEQSPEAISRTSQAQGSLQDWQQVMLTTAQFYRTALKDAPQAIEYLKSRGLSGEVAKKFGIGFAPEGWQNLEKVFDNYNAEVLNTLGLVKENEEGRRYDIFRDRVMFPIVDVKGSVIGFGGRVMGAGEPKYLNSPETPLFEKGRELYGLFQARRAIRDAKRVVVVEGYMDVVALSQFGLDYVVATLGTATTPLHIQKLLRLTDEIVFCFDGDNAGRRAAWRALENSLAQLNDGKELRFLFLPQGEDPDSFVRKNGKPAFEKCLDEAITLSQFLISELSSRVNLTTHEGRAKLLQEAKALVKQITAPLFGLMLRKQLAEVTGLTQRELESDFQIKSLPQAAPARRPPPVQRSILQTVIELLVLDPSLQRFIDRSILQSTEAMPSIDPQEKEALEQLLKVLEQSDKPVHVGEFFRQTPMADFFLSVEMGVLRWQEQGLSPEQCESEFSGAWHQFVERVRRARLGRLLEKSRQNPWSEEDRAQFLLLQQPLTHPIPK